MNTTTSTDPTAPPPQPPHPPRSSSSCDRHPDEQFTGFCPSCLCERLITLDSTSNTPSSSRRPSSASAAAAAALKSLFSATSRANNFPPPPPPAHPKPAKPSSASFFPELRRTKSFSASKNEALGLSFEPHRKSCDVRAKNTLWSLFSLDDDGKPAPASSSSHQNHHNNSKPVESFVVTKPVLEETENEEDFKDPPENIEDIVDDNGDRDEIRPVQDPHLEILRNELEIIVKNSGEIVEENVVSVNSLKPMKDHIDLVAQTQEKKSSGGGFWAAASVFSKKWSKWRRKQKIKKQSNGKSLASLPVEKPMSRQYRETQSEIADYGFGRRSIDIDPRFSLDAGRISFDDPRYSFDEPRASWDGYLMGKNFPRMAPMVSVLEDAPPARVSRADMQIPLEEPVMNFINESENVPGGSAQTRDYYLDSSTRRRKSLDRSNSIRKTAAAVVAEIDELKMASNAKVQPTTADYFHGAKVLVDSNSNSLRDDLSETFELSSGFRGSSIVGNSGLRKETKSKKWTWKIWGFMHRRNNNKDEDEDDKYSSSINGVERSLSQSWQELRREGNGGYNRHNMLRSNSSVSWRNANPHVGGPFASVRRSSVDVNNGYGKKRSDFALDKNRNVRYSPSNVDNGLLRFYLTPTRSNHRRGGTGKVKPTNAQMVTRSVMRLY